MSSAEQRPLVLEPGTRYTIDERSGRRVEYVVLRPLAYGAKSRTYLARRAGVGPAILKTSRWLPPHSDDANLEIEERILLQLEHSNVVRFLGSARAGETRLLAYERGYPNPLLLASEPAIRQHLPADPGTCFYPIPPSLALKLGADLLAGLEHMRQRGFVHHDVKLNNLLVRVATTEEDLPGHQVLDLALQGQASGVVIDVGGSRSAAYLHELNKGLADGDVSVIPPQLTPIYAPPEALLPDDERGRLQFLPSLDVYAAALVIYSMVSGRAPYDHLRFDPRDRSALSSIKAEERRGQALPISYEALAGAPGARAVAGDLYGFLTACLERRPERRPEIGEARGFLFKLAGWFATLSQGGDGDTFFGVTPQALP